MPVGLPGIEHVHGAIRHTVSIASTEGSPLGSDGRSAGVFVFDLLRRMASA
jgi:hypothetical protein